MEMYVAARSLRETPVRHRHHHHWPLGEIKQHYNATLCRLIVKSYLASLL